MLKFEITDHTELLALERALSFIKFMQSEPYGQELMGSPYIASIYERVLQSLDSYPRKNNFPGSDEAISRKLDKYFTQTIRTLLLEQRSHWSERSIEERKEYLTILLAPFTVDDEMFEELLKCME